MFVKIFLVVGVFLCGGYSCLPALANFDDGSGLPAYWHPGNPFYCPKIQTKLGEGEIIDIEKDDYFKYCSVLLPSPFGSAAAQIVEEFSCHSYDFKIGDVVEVIYSQMLVGHRGAAIYECSQHTSIQKK